MTTETGYDAAWPPAHPPQTAVVEIYMGGDTPHPWTDQDIASQQAKYGLPVWVRSNPPGPGVQADVFDALAWLKQHSVPKGCCIMLDLETAVAPDYVLPFGRALQAAGYKVLPYGSRSTLYQNPKLDGYVDADPAAAWDNKLSTVVDPGNVGTQWWYAGIYDLDTFDSSLTFWQLRDAGNPGTSTTTQPTSTSTSTPEPSPVSEVPVTEPTSTSTPGASPSSPTTNIPKTIGAKVKVFQATNDAKEGIVATGYSCLVFDNGSVTYIPNAQDLDPLYAAYGEPVRVTGDTIYNIIKKVTQ